MAEGWARLFHGDKIEAFSAGIEAHGMNPNAMQVMKEAGVDISGQSSKLASSLTDIPLDLVITVCGHADENCPAFLTKAKLVHVGFDDPPKLAKEAASEEAALDCYRRVRDEIRDFVRDKLSALIIKKLQIVDIHRKSQVAISHNSALVEAAGIGYQKSKTPAIFNVSRFPHHS